jgi:hypothetical protein
VSGTGAVNRIVRGRLATALVALVGIIGALGGVFAASATAAPVASWRLEASSATYFAPGGHGSYEVLATDQVGSGPAEEATIVDTLPAGVHFKSVFFEWFSKFRTLNISQSVPGSGAASPVCSVSGQRVTCSLPSALIKEVGSPIEPGEYLRMAVEVEVPSSTPEGTLVDGAVVEGGGGAAASTSWQNTVSAHPRFGFAKLTVQPTERTREEFLFQAGIFRHMEFVNEPYGSSFTQAGGHPWALTTTGEIATVVGEKESRGEDFPAEPVHDVKDIVVSLPPGLLGNPMAMPRCSLTAITQGRGGYPGGLSCPPDTQLGVYRFHFFGPTKEYLGPIINVIPEPGQSAEFALENTVPIDTPLLTAHLVRSENPVTGHSEYGFEVVSKSIPLVGLKKFELTFWGVPADPSHNSMRGMVCEVAERSSLQCGGGDQPAGVAPVPFGVMPSDCTAGPETATVRADSWQEPGSVGVNGRYEGFAETKDVLPAATGCNVLSFNAGTGIGVEPDTVLADEPVGLGVNLKVPQSEAPGSNAAPLLRETVVTLPDGMSVSPGVVDGIQACNEFGPEGINITGPESEETAPNGELQLAPGHCPDASILGTAEAITPFLPVPVKGHVYLARPGCGGAGQAACTTQDALDGNLYKLYLELGGTGEFANTGIEFKVPLETQANPATGQLTAIAKNLVQAPYSEVRIHLNGGPRAPLDNPAVCGTATTSADFAPWSAPGRTSEGALVSGTPDLLSSSFFNVEGCSNPTPFSPGFTAGTVSPQAGQFSSFTMNLSRQDREQYVKGIQIHTPPGLLALLSSVPLCPEDQANDPSVYGECTGSRIGTTRVASGAGSHPFEIEGSVYLTGPHDGAPFGLSIVTRAVAGPFNLGLVVVRARIDIDPESSTATITTDETGPYAVPQIIFGVPLRLQRITVNIDRPGFMFNPTNCDALQVSATISGSEEAKASVSAPFAAAGCQTLAFKPSFAVSTSGKTSRANGASLDVRLSYPANALGKDANIARVKVDLPKQLPSRLTTLQKACTAQAFNANPAQCPAASIVGVVKATTPLLPVSLSGPVYFVSHGGEAFPSLIVVLQGDGVRVDLTGATFINKAGITSSTFRTVPDVPVGMFELYLPQGKYSALAANGNLCKLQGKLKMPTEFVAQNGMVIKQSTNITVSGCTKARSARKASHHAKASRHHSTTLRNDMTGNGRTH